MKIGIIGGGSVGQKLAALIQSTGHEVVLGLRDPAKASGLSYQVAGLDAAAQVSEVVIIAIPYTACAEVLPKLATALNGKIVIDATNPLNSDWSPLLLGQENSAGEEVARLLPNSRVVKAFNTIFADIMTPERIARGGQKATAFICGDDAGANDIVAELARQIGFTPVVTGPLRNARYLEGMAHLNIAIAVGTGGGTNAAFLYHQIRG